jgi:hypothetical protein
MTPNLKYRRVTEQLCYLLRSPLTPRPARSGEVSLDIADAVIDALPAICAPRFREIRKTSMTPAHFGLQTFCLHHRAQLFRLPAYTIQVPAPRLARFLGQGFGPIQLLLRPDSRRSLSSARHHQSGTAWLQGHGRQLGSSVKP